jgi:hypothetical protein
MGTEMLPLRCAQGFGSLAQHDRSGLSMTGELFWRGGTVTLPKSHKGNKEVLCVPGRQAAGATGQVR